VPRGGPGGEKKFTEGPQNLWGGLIVGKTGLVVKTGLKRGAVPRKGRTERGRSVRRPAKE